MAEAINVTKCVKLLCIDFMKTDHKYDKKAS